MILQLNSTTKGLLLSAFIVTFAVFLPLFFIGQYYSDDFTWLWFGEMMQANPGQVLTLKAGSFFSPVMNVFYWLTLGLLKQGYGWALLLDLLVHVGVSALGGMIVWQLTKKKWLSVFGAALIATAGSGYEAVIWMAANMHMIAVLGMLIAIASYVAFRKGEKKRYFAGTVAGVVLALGTKESAVVLAPILALIFVILRVKGETVSRRHWALIGIVAALELAYLGFQLWLQSEAAVIDGGVYDLSAQWLLRYPFIVFDLLFPWVVIGWRLTAGLAILAGVAITSAAVWVTYTMRSSKLYLVGLTFTLATILPMIFFVVDPLWTALASRYTYGARIGMILMLMAILGKTTRKKLFAAIIISLTAVQLAYFYLQMTNEYVYVFQTGRAMVELVETVPEMDAGQILITGDRPFFDNRAHIVGALDVFSDIKEQDIFFAEDHPELVGDYIEVQWNPEIRIYEARLRRSEIN